MAVKEIKDMGASVLARLKKQAKETGINYQTCLQLFAQEEFLRKLEMSRYAENLVLKGGMFLYTISNYEGRPTMDIDFMLRRMSNEVAGMETIMEEICQTETYNDFITMEVLGKREITPEKKYPGIGINLMAHIKNVKIPFSVDIGVDDVIIPGAVKRTVTTRLEGFKEDGIQGLNGLTVTNITKNGFTILGTPASDVNITLPPATKAVYSMLLSGDGTFTGTCVGYQPINAKEFTITNSGNVDLENVDISITGTDKDKFELSGDGTTTIQPNDTLKVAVAPKDSLATGIYRATLTVTAANAQIATTELQFTVNEHDYVAVVTPPNCTEKGYTTYTCRNCSHSYKGNEVDATGHTWGEWKVIKEATTTETGKKERVCERCDYKEIAVISMISNKEQPTTSTKPDTAVKTGDSTNILLWSMVMVISLAGMLTALFFKRRRNR